jgi:hypothetical protein
MNLAHDFWEMKLLLRSNTIKLLLRSNQMKLTEIQAERHFIHHHPHPHPPFEVFALALAKWKCASRAQLADSDMTGFVETSVQCLVFAF